MLQDKLESLRQEALEAFQKASDSRALYETKVRFLGKQGQLSQVMKDLGKVSKEERPAFGKIVNDIKVALESTYELREAELKRAELEARMQSERVDLSLPGPELASGAVHPIPMVINEIVEILSRIGFSVRTGPVIEKDRYNFEALNIPPDHPARDMQDTFYIDPDHVLRTQTSPIQIRTLENEKPPIRIIAPGGVFRVDSDASHAPNFHQIECLVVDEKVSMADLRGTIAYFVREFFGSGIATRFRPSFFPFTEPSAEMDCQCPVCKGKGCRLCKDSGWIEIGGCGLVHPNVFRASGVAYPRWQGFAFGFGIERMAMVKYGVNDIRLFNENDRRFLEQFRL